MRRHVAILVAALPWAACGRVGFGPIDAASGPHDDGTPPGDATPDPNGLVAWYPLDEDFTGLVAHDRSGHGNDGSCTACPTVATGPHGGRAAGFDGTSQCIVVPSSPALRFTGSFTVAAWVRPERVPGAADSIVAQPVGTSTSNSWQIDVDPSSQFSYYTDAALSGTTVPTVGTWYHVAISWDGVNKLIYVGGVIEGQASGPSPPFDNDAMLIGCDDNGGSPGNFLLGAASNIVLYDRLLAGSDIAALAAL